MKCPIKLYPSTAEFIKDNDLVYFGKGSSARPFVSAAGEVLCESFPVSKDGIGRCGDYLRKACGVIESDHYFIRRADAAKHFPHALPKPRKTARYFTNKTGFYGSEAYLLFDKKPFFVYKSGRKEPAPTYTLAEAEGWAKSGAWKELTKAEALKLLDPKPVVPPAPKLAPKAPEPEVRKPMIGEIWKFGDLVCLAAQIHSCVGEFIAIPWGNRLDDKELPLSCREFPAVSATFLADSLEDYYRAKFATAPDPRIDAIKKILA